MSENTQYTDENELCQSIAALTPILDQRKQDLEALLNQATQEDVPWWRIDLARNDLIAALNTINPPKDEE